MLNIKRNLREKTSLWRHLQKTAKPIVLYGMGNGAEKVIHYLNIYGKKPYGVFASDDFVRGQSFLGYHVKKYSDFVKELDDFIVLVAFGTQRIDVIENILRINKERETYAPNVPLFGEGLFDYDYLLKYETEINNVYNNLADEKSREVFLDLCDYNISGKIDYLMNCTTDKTEIISKLRLGNNEVYLDLGAYNGDTVREFINDVNGAYERIIAVEPDKKNFAKLQKNTLQYHNINYLNYGIWQEKTELFFSSKAGRNSSLTAEGGRVVQCIGIDEIQKEFQENPITYIKMDVEGAEKQALLGAESTVKNHKPKMMVSAYHRNEDLFLLPSLIRNYNPEYEIYLRHHLYIPGWENNYYCV